MSLTKTDAGAVTARIERYISALKKTQEDLSEQQESLQEMIAVLTNFKNALIILKAHSDGKRLLESWYNSFQTYEINEFIECLWNQYVINDKESVNIIASLYHDEGVFKISLGVAIMVTSILAVTLLPLFLNVTTIVIVYILAAVAVTALAHLALIQPGSRKINDAESLDPKTFFEEGKPSTLTSFADTFFSRTQEPIKGTIAACYNTIKRQQSPLPSKISPHRGGPY